MFYTYVLMGEKDKKLYVGFTKDKKKISVISACSSDQRERARDTWLLDFRTGNLICPR